MTRKKNSAEDFSLSCPIPKSEYPHVLLAHGGGGKLMHQLIEKVFLGAFSNPELDRRHDGALLDLPPGKPAFTTDSYVVHPLFFPGGDIGKLAVCGTVNDLAMCGARPLYLSAGFILEEGLPIETLWRVVQSMKQTAQEAGVSIVTGDTKVVDRGKGDGVFINTAGVGIVEGGRRVGPEQVRPGDVVLLSGDLGRHGTAIMAARQGLEFEIRIESDCAALNGMVQALLDAGVEIHCLRDLTRGGLTSGLIEIAQGAKVQLDVQESAIPVCDEVRNFCEVLGLDPLYVANEGRFIAFVPAKEAECALAVMRQHPLGLGAVQIAQVVKGTPGLVTLETPIGTRRILDMLSGEQLPRIC